MAAFPLDVLSGAMPLTFARWLTKSSRPPTRSLLWSCVYMLLGRRLRHRCHTCVPHRSRPSPDRAPITTATAAVLAIVLVYEGNVVPPRARAQCDAVAFGRDQCAELGPHSIQLHTRNGAMLTEMPSSANGLTVLQFAVQSY